MNNSKGTNKELGQVGLSAIVHCECCSARNNLEKMSKLIPINTDIENYAELLRFCFAIEVPAGDNCICNNCIIQLHQCYNFKMGILKTQQVLLTHSLNNGDSDTEETLCSNSNVDTSVNEKFGHTQSKADSKIKITSSVNEKINIKTPNRGRKLPYQLDRISLTCQICNLKFMQFKELQKHMPIHYPEYICHTCGRLFPDLFHLKLHEKSHHDRIFECDHCGQTFKTRSTLQQHIKVIHLGLKKKFRCSSCDQSFATYYMRLKHMIDRHNIEGKKFQCSLCERQFHLSNHLQEHVRKQHLNVRPYECDKCSYKGHTTWALKQHYVMHTGDKKFQCDVCYKTYGRTTTLQEHKKIHLSNLDE